VLALICLPLILDTTSKQQGNCNETRLSLITTSPPTTQPTIRLRLGLDWELASSLTRIVSQPAHPDTLIDDRNAKSESGKLAQLLKSNQQVALQNTISPTSHAILPHVSGAERACLYTPDGKCAGMFSLNTGPVPHKKKGIIKVLKKQVKK